MTQSQQLNQKSVVGVKREEADDFKQLRGMNGGDDVHPGNRTHPGTNAGPMHAGVVMRRMLELMRNRAAGRHGQQGNDGEGDDPNDGFETGCSHSRKTKEPGRHATKVSGRPSTQLSPPPTGLSQRLIRHYFRRRE